MKEFDDEYQFDEQEYSELLQYYEDHGEGEAYLLELLNRFPELKERFITEDQEFTEGKISKTLFLEKMESRIREDLRATFKGTKFSEADCPWLEHLFRHYHRRDACYLESSLRKYLPARENIYKAEDYIPLISEKAKHAVDQWLKTGEITGIPDEIPKRFMQTAEQYTANIRAKMGDGKPLEGGTKQKMEDAFGSNLNDITIHTDKQADKIAREVDAAALTIGNDIAFANDRYKPGTPVGDALIAHELAHTLQQKEANKPGDTSSYNAMEKDAEASARGVLGRLWGNVKSGTSGWGKQVMPRMKSGLQLQRCKSDEEVDVEKIRLDDLAREKMKENKISFTEMDKQEGHDNTVFNTYHLIRVMDYRYSNWQKEQQKIPKGYGEDDYHDCVTSFSHMLDALYNESFKTFNYADMEGGKGKAFESLLSKGYIKSYKDFTQYTKEEVKGTEDNPNVVQYKEQPMEWVQNICKKSGVYIFGVSLNDGFHGMNLIVDNRGSTSYYYLQDQHMKTSALDRRSALSPNEVDEYFLEFSRVNKSAKGNRKVKLFELKRIN